eukprot:jgi/Astpho2/1710/e_gw1.00032.69.1_t
MVFSGAVDRVVGKQPRKGDAVLVTDGAETALAWGVYNGSSMFRVRLMQLESSMRRPGALDLAFNVEALVAARLQTALQLRAALGISQQGIYRLVNAEGDRLSGLVVDVFRGQSSVHLAVVSSAAWVERYRPFIEQQLCSLFNKDDSPEVIWLPAAAMLQEEGIAADVDAAAQPTEEAPTVQVEEHSVKYKIAQRGGQKTGFYADQRDSRRLIQQLCREKRVLDLCCYTGGFALNAAVGGAAHVTGVDTSASAIQQAHHNAALNGLPATQYTFVREDIQDFLKDHLRDSPELPQAWDVVVLDPPKLAPNRKSLDKANSMYRKLNGLAMRVIKPGGLLMTCSCSGAMTQSGNFVDMLQASSHKFLSMSITIVRMAGAAPDHTLDPAYPEGAYLTNVLLRVL